MNRRWITSDPSGDAGDETPELTAEQAAELDRRVAAYEADPQPSIPWREFMDLLDRELDRAPTPPAG